jgi:hypothetical protein
MKRILLSALGFILAFQVSSQSLSKKFFRNTEWFSNNIDSLFFKSDTIKLIKYSNLVSKSNGYNIYAESEQEYLKHGYSVYFHFYKSENMDFAVRTYHMSTKIKIGERTWKYIQKENALKIVHDGALEYYFTVIGIKEIGINSMANQIKDPISTIEMTLVKHK